MRGLAYIILALVIISYAEIPSLAAVDRETPSEEVISSIVEDRIRARQEYEEYQQYKLQEKAKKRAPVQIKVPIIPKEEEAPYARSKNDIMIGTGLILAAIVLSVYLHKLTKKEQNL